MKLQKIESSCEEGGSAASIIGRTIAPTSPTSSGSKFYKNLKKIKRNHGAENPTKNYYLAFPALSSQNTTATTTITSGGAKRSSPGGVETKKDSKNLQLLCWSNLMTKENSPAREAVVTTVKRPRRKRRYGRHKSVKNDVQFNAKTYDGATLSPKAQSGSKKHQRNQFGKFPNPIVDSYLTFPYLFQQSRRQRTLKVMSSNETITFRMPRRWIFQQAVQHHGTWTLRDIGRWSVT